MKKLWEGWIHPKTLVGICTSRLIVYVVFVTLIYQAYSMASSELWKRSFPEIDDYVSYSAMLYQDDFARIPASRFENCGIMIYGEKGRVIYSTTKDVKMLVSAEELQFIPDMNDAFSYSVMEGEEDDIWIFKVVQGEEEGETNIEDFCRLDSDYKIIEGSLFSEYGQISARTVGFLRGVYGKNRSIMKYTYTNVDDKERTLVFLSPVGTPELMGAYFHQLRVLWGICLLLNVLGALVTACFIAKRVRMSVLPLNTLFEDYINNKTLKRDHHIPGELASIEQNFIHLTERLEASNQHRIEMEQEKNRMIADLSHDLKSPLTVIGGYSQALISGKVTGEDVKRYLEVIYKKSTNSVEMINNLMQYASMEHPDYRAHKEPIDFAEFLRVCLINRYEELEEQGIELELEIPEEEVLYDVDTRIMGSVMENLINNTIRYNDPGTVIFVSLDSTDRGLTVTFADTGVGIPEEIRKDVFKPFVIGNKARTSGKGTGIGMSIIRRGVEMHGGTVELVDAKGTSFSTIFEMRFPTLTELRKQEAKQALLEEQEKS